ncbi:uncharacterized protein LOC131306516 isoform X2 [Rhododendron vialii]|uniref:uncharacterized protein LOC131306516 isoform X2 n=1 Tax=Rhododendron vialii TaxID=182163 RepID=UPI00265FDA06|nr:uncharacterized protein LOC131306516 isoform X2 [Rhododendron vialii]
MLTILSQGRKRDLLSLNRLETLGQTQCTVYSRARRKLRLKKCGMKPILGKIQHLSSYNLVFHSICSKYSKEQIDHVTPSFVCSTIIWSRTVLGCSVFVEDIRQLIVDPAISGNVIDAYVEILSTEQGGVADQMQGDCTQVKNKTVYVFTCNFLKNQVESYWKSTRDGLLTTQDCEPTVTVPNRKIVASIAVLLCVISSGNTIKTKKLRRS